jgi:hypothetical protein
MGKVSLSNFEPCVFSLHFDIILANVDALCSIFFYNFKYHVKFCNVCLCVHVCIDLSLVLVDR